MKCKHPYIEIKYGNKNSRCIVCKRYGKKLDHPNQYWKNIGRNLTDEIYFLGKFEGEVYFGELLIYDNE